MSALTPIFRQIILLQLLQQKRDGVTLTQIAEYMTHRLDIDGHKYIERNFQRDKTSIYRDYKVEISYTDKVYRIVNSPAELSLQLLEVFGVMNILLQKEEFTNHLVFDTRKAKGLEHFQKLLQAIKASVWVRFNYQSFFDEEASKRLVEPYALKEYKGRWYLLAKDTDDERVKTFGLDRMTSPALSKKKFIYPDNFDPLLKFKNCIGIISDDDYGPPEEVVLALTSDQYNYLKSFPLHHTQREIEDPAGNYIITLNVCITYDLEMEVLSYGESVEVLEPEYFRERIKKRLQDAFRLYKTSP